MMRSRVSWHADDFVSKISPHLQFIRSLLMSLSPDAPLEFRDDSETGPYTRVYIHDACQQGTAVGDSSFTHVVNPFRVVTASICAKCDAVSLKSLRWEDTGETVAAFRSRMWRLTPVYVKLIHFLLIPGLLGLLGAAAVPGDVIEGSALWIARAACFAGVYLVMLLILWITPLAGMAPAMCGMKYHKYR